MAAYLDAVSSYTPPVVKRAVDDWLAENPSAPPQAPELKAECDKIRQGDLRRSAPRLAGPGGEDFCTRAKRLELPMHMAGGYSRWKRLMAGQHKRMSDAELVAEIERMVDS